MAGRFTDQPVEPTGPVLNLDIHLFRLGIFANAKMRLLKKTCPLEYIALISRHLSSKYISRVPSNVSK